MSTAPACCSTTPALPVIVPARPRLRPGPIVVAVLAWFAAYVAAEPASELLTYRLLGLELGGRLGAAVAFFTYEAPKVLLLLSWNPSAREIGALERDHVHKLNVVRAAHSERYLFAHIKDKRITDLAEKYKDSRPGLAVEGFGPKRFAPIKVARR